jgi:hypothetical protein
MHEPDPRPSGPPGEAARRACSRISSRTSRSRFSTSLRSRRRNPPDPQTERSTTSARAASDRPPHHGRRQGGGAPAAVPEAHRRQHAGAGTVSFVAYRQLDDDREIVLLERYASREAFEDISPLLTSRSSFSRGSSRCSRAARSRCSTPRIRRRRERRSRTARRLSKARPRRALHRRRAAIGRPLRLRRPVEIRLPRCRQRHAARHR